MKTGLLNLCFLILICCSSAQTINKNVDKILDLSGKNLSHIPDLSTSDYSTIDLSNNNIVQLNMKMLPKNLKKLNLSHNKITKSVLIHNEECKNLNYLDLSYNKLSHFSSSCDFDSLILNNNTLEGIGFYTKRMSYLDMSNNPALGNIIDVPVKHIKNIKRDNIKNNLPLIYTLDYNFEERKNNLDDVSQDGIKNKK